MAVVPVSRYWMSIALDKSDETARQRTFDANSMAKVIHCRYGHNWTRLINQRI
jgi:hypothetical protein